MQLSVRVAAATRFAGVVYKGLARGDSVQRAVSQARQALYVEEGDGASWYVPTLTIRARDTGPLRLVPPLVPPPPPAGKPFLAPEHSRFFVDRPEVSRDLKARLLGDGAAHCSLVISAIHGLGGIGKSTLAAALAHDPEVLVHFPDGVLWVTLGQRPDLLSLLSVWVQAM